MDEYYYKLLELFSSNEENNILIDIGSVVSIIPFKISAFEISFNKNEILCFSDFKTSLEKNEININDKVLAILIGDKLIIGKVEML